MKVKLAGAIRWGSVERGRGMEKGRGRFLVDVHAKRFTEVSMQFQIGRKHGLTPK